MARTGTAAVCEEVAFRRAVTVDRVGVLARVAASFSQGGVTANAGITDHRRWSRVRICPSGWATLLVVRLFRGPRIRNLTRATVSGSFTKRTSTLIVSLVGAVSGNVVGEAAFTAFSDAALTVVRCKGFRYRRSTISVRLFGFFAVDTGFGKATRHRLGAPSAASEPVTGAPRVVCYLRPASGRLGVLPTSRVSLLLAVKVGLCPSSIRHEEEVLTCIFLPIHKSEIVEKGVKSTCPFEQRISTDSCLGKERCSRSGVSFYSETGSGRGRRRRSSSGRGDFATFFSRDFRYGADSRSANGCGGKGGSGWGCGRGSDGRSCYSGSVKPCWSSSSSDHSGQDHSGGSRAFRQSSSRRRPRPSSRYGSARHNVERGTDLRNGALTWSSSRSGSRCGRRSYWRRDSGAGSSTTGCRRTSGFTSR